MVLCDKYNSEMRSLLCTGMQRRCPYDGDFRCRSSGECIRSSSVCDEHKHCADGSDEENCGMLVL